MNHFICIGITGGIGSGKTRVSRFWSDYAGLPLIDIDQLCKELLEVEMPGWHTLRKHLGDSYFLADGQLDRPGLRSAIFEDDSLRKEVNRLIHPLALDLFHTKTETMDHPVLVDVPLLYEAGWEDQFDHAIVVYSDPHTCCNRIQKRDKMSADEALKAVGSQMDIWIKAMQADHVIDNRYDWFRTYLQIVHLARMLNTKFQ